MAQQLAIIDIGNLRAMPAAIAANPGSIAIEYVSGTGLVQVNDQGVATPLGGGSTLTISTGLTLAGDILTANLSTGVNAATQTVVGGTATTQSLVLRPNGADTTTGKVYFGGALESAYSAVNGWLGIGTASPNILTFGGTDTRGISIVALNSFASLEMKRTTATAGSTVGYMPFFNGTTNVAAFGCIGGGANDAGSFTFETKPTAGAIATRLTITGAGAFNFAAATTLGFYGATAVAQQTVGAVTNSVTAGGSNGVIADYAIVDYATDAAAIRNDIYQLARSVNQLAAAARNLGLGA